jgi:hypothetical protein
VNENPWSDDQGDEQRPLAIRFNAVYGRFRINLEISEATFERVQAIAVRAYATLYILLMVIQLVHPHAL